MKDSETLIEKLAHRRADAVVTPLAVSKTDQPSPPVANEKQVRVAPTLVARELQDDSEPDLAAPSSGRSSWRSWVLALGVVLIGFWMFTSVVTPRHGTSAQASKPAASSLEGSVVRPVAPPAPVVSVPMSDSQPVPAAAPVVQEPIAQEPVVVPPAPKAKALPQRQTERAAPATKTSAWRETVSPLPTYDEANDGSIDRSSRQTSSSNATRSPTIALAPVRAADKSAGMCSAMQGLALAQCKRCDLATSLAKPFCLEQARLDFCQGRYGKSADCPLVGYANGF